MLDFRKDHVDMGKLIHTDCETQYCEHICTHMYLSKKIIILGTRMRKVLAVTNTVNQT